MTLKYDLRPRAHTLGDDERIRPMTSRFRATAVFPQDLVFLPALLEAAPGHLDFVAANTAFVRKRELSVPFHFYYGWPYGHQPFLGDPALLHTPVRAAAPWTAPPRVLPTAAIQPPRPWHDLRWHSDGGSPTRQAEPPPSGARSDAELASLRDKVRRLTEVLSHHDKGIK